MKNLGKYNLFINVFKQGKFYVAYCPALDMSSCGKTEKQSLKMIDEAIHILFEELDAEKKLESFLLDMGWEKKDNKLQPPIISPYTIELSHA
jgi:predicted RNase H-like HicB family nuclease